jgi:hypothetical protein
MIVFTLEKPAPAKRRVIIPCHSYKENKRISSRDIIFPNRVKIYIR